MNFSRTLRETDTFHRTGALNRRAFGAFSCHQFARKMATRISLLVFVLLFGAGGVIAHQTTDSFLALSLANQQIQGRWAISLRDLDHVLTIDVNKDGEVSDTELTAATLKIENYAFDHLEVRINSRAIRPNPTGFEIEEHSDAVYGTVLFVLKPEVPPIDLLVTYRLFNDTDPLHRGLFRLDMPNRTATAIFSPSQPTQRFRLSAPETPARLLNFVREGVWHIWTGYDHILFLIALLLPAVLQRQGGAWAPAEGVKAALLNIVKVVTAFTVAHSITLTLATMGWVNLPSRFIESVIAASVVIAALNNLKPLFAERTWMIAFGFGLIHGFGFASALTELHLSATSLAGALVGFNLGVELGQLAIVFIFVPIAFALRKRAFYQQVALRYCSILIVVLASAWFFERAFNQRILPF